MNYPIGDFLIRVKNVAMAGNKELIVKKTKLIKAVSDVMKKIGYLDDVLEDGENIKVRLAYKRKRPVLMQLKLMSTPGMRVYMNVEELEKIKGPSTYVLTTPLGVLSKEEAIKKRVGGEVIAELL